MKLSSQETYTYSFPTSIRFGAGVARELPGHLLSKGYKKPLLVTDPTCSILPFFFEIQSNLEEAGLRPEVFTEVHANPLRTDVAAGKQRFISCACDCIVGIGGGASLDVARSVALWVMHPGDLFDYEEVNGGAEKVTEHIPYFVCIPTTSGTGSEVGRSAVIADERTQEKKILFSPRLLASQVFADPLLTMSLPPDITAATGMDALTHHMEAYLSKGFHPLCDGIALEGMRVIRDHLEEATLRPSYDARAQMMIAALMGAVAFQKGLGVVHSLAHPLSSLHGIHHGLANAIMLPHGLRYNAVTCLPKMLELEKLFGTDDVPGYIEDLRSRLGLASRLSELGIEIEHLDNLSEWAEHDACHASNPRECTVEDFYVLYEAAL